jgi:CarD family transcriptional regulator
MADQTKKSASSKSTAASSKMTKTASKSAVKSAKPTAAAKPTVKAALIQKAAPKVAPKAAPKAEAKAVEVAPQKPALRQPAPIKPMSFRTPSAFNSASSKPSQMRAPVQAAPLKPVVAAAVETPAVVENLVPVVPPVPVVNATFNVGDNAVYPGHGVGKVTAIESKEIFGKKHEFYSIQILENGMKIMIPKDNVASVGLRPIISRDEAAKVISILRETNVKIDNQTWNRRYREYMEKIKTGSVFEIAEVLRDLFLLKVDKELSFGERKMLDTARGLLLKELSLATSREELAGQDEVAAIFGLQGT